MIPKTGKGFIDVGTDHGMIPLMLAASGYQGNIFASDIGEAPINHARQTARAQNLENRIHFLCCDGLDQCPPEKVDCIMIAGMGGDTICRILDHAEWIYSDSYLLILQPMTKAEVLRYWLLHNEFVINQEAVACEDKHVYQIFSSQLGKSKRYKDAEYLVGSHTALRMGDPVQLLIEQESRVIERSLRGL